MADTYNQPPSYTLAPDDRPQLSIDARWWWTGDKWIPFRSPDRAEVAQKLAPQYSPDGRSWWTGEQWIPVPLQGPSAAPGARPLIAPIVAALVIFSFIVIGAFGVVSENQRQAEHSRELSQIICEEEGIC